MRLLGFFLATALLVSVAGCAASRPTADRSATHPSAENSKSIKYEGGDGSSCERAIVIRGAANDGEGVDAEYTWLRAHYPGYRLKSQATQSADGRDYDALTIKTADGSKVDVCFDITDFFGKW